MSHSITLHGIKYLRLIGDEETFREAELLSIELNKNNLTCFVTSVEMTNTQTHIVTSGDRDRVMDIARMVISDAEITCI